MHIERCATNPIITPASHPSLGNNINGPSLIRVPSWVKEPLGRYYLYFAHHNGKHIRMAYADQLDGPWTIHAPGVLHVDDSTCLDHIASPDVHVDDEQQTIRMYFHGVAFPGREQTDGHELFGEASRWIGNQRSKVATSPDGLLFTASPQRLGASYFRVFRHLGWTYALAMPGVFYRSRDGLHDFAIGPICFPPTFRHCAVIVRRDTLHILYTNVGDAPESILYATVDLAGDWTGWKATPHGEVLRPEMAYEGADLPLAPSRRGAVEIPVRELRDPALFEERGQLHLLYSVAGESGVAIAHLTL